MVVGRIVEAEREARKDGANRGDKEKRPHENLTTQVLPWKIIYQNIRRLITNNKKNKIHFFDEYTKQEKVIIMNFTETWMDEKMVGDPEIKGYKLYRGDRSHREGGGTAIYIKEEFEAQKIAELSTNEVEMVAVFIEKLNILNVVIYRPPCSQGKNFLEILKTVKEILKKTKAPEPTIIITGDFNFPFLEWKRGRHGGCEWKKKTETGATREEKLQFERLNEEMDNFGLVQAIEEPTRGKNTLDLIYTNEISMIIQVEVVKSNLSDHDRVELTTNIKYRKNEEESNGNRNKKEMGMKKLNYISESIEWIVIRKELEGIQWKELFGDKDTETCLNILLKIVMELCEKYVPEKKAKSGSIIPKRRKQLFQKMKLLRRSKKSANKKRKEEIDRKILEVEKEILNHKKEERSKKEKLIIENMNKKPKIFHDFIKNKENRENKLGPLKVDGEYIRNNKEICDAMTKQYNTQYSDGKNNEKISDKIFDDPQKDDITDIIISEEDIKKAIGEIDPNSTAGPEGVSAKFLRETMESIAVPLTIIMRKSIDQCEIPDILKLAYVTPIHKGGSRMKPENYRPVSLTSHIMKIFERVIKVRLIEHLKKYKLINKGQHGFVEGRSTQTQLLEHFCRVYEALEEGARMDTVYLDFAKAFDKVDHDILMEKLAKNKIKGKLGKWIREFLRNRKYRVVANGEISEEQEVRSGVPQGTVLAAILFLIMIGDIDEEIMSCIVSCFADDTRNSKKIKGEEDIKAMQDDLNKIYDWAEKNIMKFNEGKFEQMTWGEIKDVDVEAYKTPSGKEIEIKDKVKDLGVVTSADLRFREHINEVITSCKIKQGNILRNFTTRKREPMMKLFKSHMRSKAEYCCIVWSPTYKKEISRLERIQKGFTKRIEGMEGKNYHQRLKCLDLYSMERRRERYMIINAWQQVEEQRENIMGFEMNERARHRTIKDTRVKWNRNSKNSTIVHNSPARKMMRLFNAMPGKIRDIAGVKLEIFKRELDNWLRVVPDAPEIDDYRAAANSNSLIHQAVYAE